MKEKKPGLTEAIITRHIKWFLTAKRVFFWKQWQGPMSSRKGVSDIIGIKVIKVSDLVKAKIEKIGVFMAIEVKRPGAKLSKHQEDFRKEVKDHFGISIVAWDVKDVSDYFEPDKAEK